MPVSVYNCNVFFLLLCQCVNTVALSQLPLYTYSRLKGKTTNGGGSGWSIEGREKYDELFLAVKADRKKHAKTFNPQLLLFYQARRRREQQAKTRAMDETKPSAKPGYHRMDELAEDTDDDADGFDEGDDDEDNGTHNVEAV